MSLATKRNGWRDGKLSDLVVFQRGYDITVAQQRPGPHPVISSSGVTSYHDEYKAEGPGVVIGRKGTIGSIHFADSNYWPHDTTLWSKDLKGNNARFVFYFLHTVDLKRFDVGNSNPTLNRNHIHDLPIWIPQRPIQDQIASVLAAYDDLIENNRRRMKLLEDAARLLYQEWFVRLRFPGHERVRVKDGVPEGWRVLALGDALADIDSGGRPKGGAVDADGIPSIGAENVLGIGQYDFSKEKFIPENYFERMTGGVVKNRDVLLYKDGANIGRSSYVGDGFPHDKCAVNEHVFLLRSRDDIGQNFLYFWISTDESRQRIANLNANCAQPGISRERLKGLLMTLPTAALVREFNESVEPQVKLIFRLAVMNRRLRAARDLLLPRLMSGEVEV